MPEYLRFRRFSAANARAAAFLCGDAEAAARFLP